MRADAWSLPVLGVFCRLGRLLGLEGGSSGAMGRGAASRRADCLGERRSHSNSGCVSRSLSAAGDRGHSPSLRAGFTGTSREQNLGHSAGIMSDCSSTGSFREARRSRHCTPGVRFPSVDLGVAHDGSAGVRCMVPQQARDDGVLRSSLETILSAEADIGKYLADRIFLEFGSLNNALIASPARLATAIGAAAAEKLLAFRELSRAVLKEQIQTRPWLSIEEMAAIMMMEIGYSTVEVVYAIYLDVGGCVIQFEQATKGTSTTALVDARAIIIRAVEEGASALILAHNHPSGDPRPSSGDHRLTDRLSRMCTDFDLRFVDHIIVGRGRAYSIRRRSLIEYGNRSAPSGLAPQKGNSRSSENGS